jgi:tetratricopeptide (TPR) repeat protein
MAFRGDLGNINLASVLQNLLHNEQTGTLRIFDEDREAYIYFDAGQLSMYSSGSEGRTPLDEYLSRAGDVTDKQVATAKKRLRGRRNLTSVLTRMGIEAEKIRGAIRRFVEEEVCDLFTWESGRFEFSEGLAPAGIFDSDMGAAKLGIDPNGVILEAARRADTWDQINSQIRSDSEIFVLRREADEKLAESFEPEIVEVARMLDGRRNVTALAEESGLGRFTVLHALSQLIVQRAVRPISLTEVIKLAENALGNRDFGEAVRFYRRALETERNNLECRRGLIEALEGSGEGSEASAERKLLAVTLRDTGRMEEAAEELRRAIEHAPTDITAREKHVSLLKEMGSTQQAETASLELGKAYLSLGVAEKAREVFAGVLSDGPHELTRVAVMLADACVKTGDIAAAVGAYRTATSHHLAAEEYGSAASICEEVLKLQPDNAEARKRLDDINTGRMLRRKRRWRTVRYLFLLFALAVLAATWFTYDWSAGDHLEEMSQEALVRVERGDFRGAMTCYAQVGERYPLTRASARAARLSTALADLAALKALEEARRLGRLGETAAALELCTRAEKFGPSDRVMKLVRAARARLKPTATTTEPPAEEGTIKVPSPDGSAGSAE